jgi:hypothetical protein
MKKIMTHALLSAMLALALSVAAFAGSMTDTYENKVADVIFRAQAFSETSPASHYVALFTTSCTDSALGTEVSGGSYARVAVTRATTSWKGTHGSTTGASSGTNGTISNAAIIQFPAPTANWGSVTAFAIMDASTGGAAVVCNNLTVAKTVNNGDAAPSFAVDALTVQVDN